MPNRNSALVFQALLYGLIQLCHDVLNCPDYFSAFSDIAEEWNDCEAKLSELILVFIQEYSKPDEVNNV